MSSHVELRPLPLRAGPLLRVALPDSAARAVGTAPGDRWMDDLVTTLLETRPEGFHDFLTTLAESLATATVTFVVPSMFEGDQPLEIVRWAEAPTPDRRRQEPPQAPAPSADRRGGAIPPVAARRVARQGGPPPGAFGNTLSISKRSTVPPSAASGSRRVS